MKQSPILIFFILILAMPAASQDAVNTNDRQRFNGTWIFDAKKSDRNFRDVYEGQTLEISYQEPELKILRTRTVRNETKSSELILFTDNRGEKNKPYPQLEVTSNTVWERDKLIRTYTLKIYTSGKVVGGNTVKENYALSEDGDTLTIIEESRTKTTSDSRYGELKTDHKGRTKLVYQRKK